MVLVVVEARPWSCGGPHVMPGFDIDEGRGERASMSMVSPIVYTPKQPTSSDALPGEAGVKRAPTLK